MPNDKYVYSNGCLRKVQKDGAKKVYHGLSNPLDAQEVGKALAQAQELYAIGMYSEQDKNERIQSIRDQVELYKKWEAQK